MGSPVVRVMVEVGNTAAPGAPGVRIYHEETVIPANQDASDFTDLVLLGQAVIRRLAEDARDRGCDQIEQVFRQAEVKP